MSNYVVTDETIRLNKEATNLNSELRRVTNDSADLWNEITRKLDRHARLQQELGELRYRLIVKEEELEEAVRRGA